MLEDERFTTMQARDTQIMGGVKRDDRKKTIDSIAASYILDGYLAKMKKQNEVKKMDNERMDEFYDDEEERITKVTDSVDGVTEYTYDALGQLLTERLNNRIRWLRCDSHERF